MAEPKEPPVERRYRGGQIFDGTRLHRDAVLDLGGVCPEEGGCRGDEFAVDDRDIQR